MLKRYKDIGYTPYEACKALLVALDGPFGGNLVRRFHPLRPFLLFVPLFVVLAWLI